MHLLFSYGTLQQPGLQRQLFGRELAARPDVLPRYRMTMLAIKDPAVVAASGLAEHPIAAFSGDPGDGIPGTVLELTDAELAAADDYEVEDYTRALVPLTSGANAWVYAATHRSSAGDVDYDTAGHGYAGQRRPDPRIEATIHRAFGDARTVLNVGAGAGSYEPADRYVVAVEPSAAMRAQRPPGAVPAIDATAGELPFDDDAFGASLAAVTVHQWPDTARGLAELRRVTRGPVVVLTFDGDALDLLWLADYAPELIAAERRRYPPIDQIAAAIGTHTEITPVPVPIDCVDGFTEAYYARPERFLDPAVRAAQSAWTFVDQTATDRAVARLRSDLASGAWDDRYGHLRTQPHFTGSLRLLVGHP
jgi:SAM-dependent methyltransferase